MMILVFVGWICALFFSFEISLFLYDLAEMFNSYLLYDIAGVVQDGGSGAMTIIMVFCIFVGMVAARGGVQVDQW